MICKLHIPQYPLNQFIESFFYYRDYNPVHSIDRFLPDGNVNIVFDLTDYPKFIYDNDTLKEIQACRHVWFSGIRNKFISIPSGKDSEMLVVNFHKGKSYPFIEMPLSELTDSVVDGDLALTDEIMNIRDGILNQPTVDGKLLYAEKQLFKFYTSRLVLNPFIDYAVNRILSSPTQLSIDDLSQKVGYSQKHLIHLFKRHVGVTPKTFLKITRFQKAIAELEQPGDVNWASIANESGFFDQAHFIHDFKAFSGFTPEQYLLQKNDQLNYVPVA